MAQHLRIGSVIDYLISESFEAPGHSGLTVSATGQNVTVTNIHSAYIEVEYDLVGTVGSAPELGEFRRDDQVKVIPWGITFHVIED